MPLLSNNRDTPGAMFFAAYVGPSMNPTLREPDVMEIMPYGRSSLRVGDVVLFLLPENDHPIVHRVVRTTPAGITTLGDNNTRTDAVLLQPKSIQGRVVAAWRGRERRRIAGGWQGRLAYRLLRWRRGIDRGVSPMLHPFYQTLFHWGLIARLLPARFKPRVVVFQSRGQDQFQLLMGRHVIGRYNDQRHRWMIRRPYHLLVDGRTLPSRQDKARSHRQIWSERQHAANNLLSQEVQHKYCLALADGSQWEISAGNMEAAPIVSQLGCAMQLRVTTGEPDPFSHGKVCRLLVQVAANTSVADCYVPLASERDGDVVCILNPSEQWGSPYVNLVRLSLVLARESQARGGLLIHGALAERGGAGVILAAPGGTGKTTASGRLPAPWRSLCDDTTLVVRDPKGTFMAHPWPTWSRFMNGGAGGTWNVQSAVPVRGIFFLLQADGDRVTPIGDGESVSMLGECVRQVSTLMAPGLFKEELHAMHLERFNNLCAVARAVPSHMLHISLNGAFWQEIEQVLDGCAGRHAQQPQGEMNSHCIGRGRR